MFTLEGRNAHTLLPQALALLKEHGLSEDSRNGPVLRMPAPVATTFLRPLERVVFHPWRDANPFFHCMEALWMLAGRDTLKELTVYVKQMAQYSDDGGVTQPAAYGKRWRGWFRTPFGSDPLPFDQLNWSVERLRDNPNDRRVVIQMWDADEDPAAVENQGADVPCNLTMLPWVSGGQLHLTVFNRSHDIVWGLFGANCVHFATVLEYLAARLGLPVGTLTFVSNNFHGYLKTMPDKKPIPSSDGFNPYMNGTYPYPIFHGFDNFGDFPMTAELDVHREKVIQEDLKIFFDHGAAEAATKARWPYIRQVAVPLALAHAHYKSTRKDDRYTGAIEILQQCRAADWRVAATEWILRRQAAQRRAQDDGVYHADAE